MYPELFRIPEFEMFGRKFGDFPVMSFGVVVMLGIVLAIWMGRKRAQQWGIRPDQITDAAFWGVIPGILGARIGYIVQEWSYFSEHPEKLWSLEFAGMTSFGGILLAVIGLIVYAKIKKINGLAFMDVLAVPLLIAEAVGRFGCLLNGCCYGHPTTKWYGVHVQGAEGLFQPAQMFDSVFVILIGALILVFERKMRPYGSSIALAVGGWGVSRFFYEFFRAGTNDEVARGQASSTYWGDLPITQAQGAALVMIALAAGLFIYSYKREKKKPQATNEPDSGSD